MRLEKPYFQKKFTLHSEELNRYMLIKTKTRLILTIFIPWLFLALMLPHPINILFWDFLLFLIGGAGLFLFIKIVIFKRPHDLSIYQHMILMHHKHIFYSGIILATISWIVFLILQPDPGLIFALIGFIFTPPLIAYYRFLVRKCPYLFEKKIY